MKNPLVSVVITSHNYRRHIASCLKSVLQQDYPNFEVVVIDDGSTDDSLEIINGFKSDSKLHILALDKNVGFPASKNEGIIASKGEYIITLDADDVMMPTSISKRVAAVLEHKVDFVHALAHKFSGQAQLEDLSKLTSFRSGRVAVHAQTTIIARWVHQKWGLYDETTGSPSDKEMWYRLLGREYGGDTVKRVKLPASRVKHYKLQEYVVFYRRHVKSMTAAMQRGGSGRPNIRRYMYSQVVKRIHEGVTTENTKFLVE